MYRLCCMVSHDVVAISIWNPATSKPPFVKGPSCLMLDTDTFDVSPIHLIYQNPIQHYKYHAVPCIVSTSRTLFPIKRRASCLVRNIRFEVVHNRWVSHDDWTYHNSSKHLFFLSDVSDNFWLISAISLYRNNSSII